MRRILHFGVAALLLWMAWKGLAGALPDGPLMDFGSFWASGEAATAGHNPYGVYPLTLHVVLPGFDTWNPNLNPPVSLPLFALLAHFEPMQAFRVWWFISLFCYLVALALLAWRHRRPVMTLAWPLALAGLWDTLVLGQIYLPLVLAAVGAWLLLERQRWLAAGLLIGLLVAIKPNFLVWPALLLVAGAPRPALVAGAVALLLSAVPLLLYGPQVYGQWFDLVVNDTSRAAFLTNVSVTGLVQRLGQPWLGTAASLALLLGVAGVTRWRRLSPLQASALGLVAALLASPIAWVHYTLFLLPVFALLPASPMRVAAQALLIVPVPVVLDWLAAPAWQQATIGSVYAWAVVLVLAALLRAMPGDQAAEVSARVIPQHR